MPILSPGRDRFLPLMLLKEGTCTVVTSVVQMADDKRKVARLFLQSPGVSESDLLHAVDREATLLRGVSHPALARFDRVVEGEGGTWLFFDYVRGTPLSHYFGCEASIPSPWIVTWLHQTLCALQALHEARIAIGYLEPADLVVNGPQLVVVDLGILERMFPDVGVRLLKDHPYLNFVAPERRNALRPGPAHDLFSAAGVAFWLATGRAPSCRSAQSAELHRAALGEARPDLPGPVSDLIAESLAFHPGRRPASAQAMLERLQGHLVDLKGQRPPPAPEGNAAFKEAARTTRPLIEVEEARPAPPPLAVPAEPPPAEPEPALRPEMLDDLSWHLRQNRALQLGVLLMVLLPLWLLSQLLQPKVAPPPPLFVVTAGRLMQQVPHQPWVPASSVAAGATVAAERQDVQLRFEQDSALTMRAGTALSCAGPGTVSLQCGALQVRTGAADSLKVALPARDYVEVGPRSGVTVDTRSGVLVSVMEGHASVVLPDGEHPVQTGKSLRLSLDGRKILP